MISFGLMFCNVDAAVSSEKYLVRRTCNCCVSLSDPVLKKITGIKSGLYRGACLSLQDGGSDYVSRRNATARRSGGGLDGFGAKLGLQMGRMWDELKGAGEKAGGFFKQLSK